MKQTISVSISEDVLERLNDQLDYGDSRSDWVEEAIVEKLEREEADEGNPKAAATAK